MLLLPLVLSCSSDDDDISPEQSALIGAWENTITYPGIVGSATTGYAYTSVTVKCYLDFERNKLTYYTWNSPSENVKYTYNYSVTGRKMYFYDNIKIEIYDMNWKLKDTKEVSFSEPYEGDYYIAGEELKIGLPVFSASTSKVSFQSFTFKKYYGSLKEKLNKYQQAE